MYTRTKATRLLSYDTTVCVVCIVKIVCGQAE